MYNLDRLEESYKRIASNIDCWPVESTLVVNLNVLKELNLLHYHSSNFYDPKLTRYFQIIETFEKITLVNEDFTVWIVPVKENIYSYTRIMIAVNQDDKPTLELVIITSGVYNTSRLVLRILEKKLFDIQENEEEIKKIIKTSKT